MKNKIISFLTCIFLSLQVLGQNVIFDWGVNIGGSSGDLADLTTVDNANNIYVTGLFTDTVDFNAVDTLTNNLNGVGVTRFLCKKSPEGNLLWAKSFEMPNAYLKVNSMEIDGENNIYLYGTFAGVVDFDLGVDTFNLSTNNSSIFICKLDSNGIFKWAYDIGNNFVQIGHSMTLDGLGNIYCVGYFNGDSDSIDFDPGIGESYLSPTVGPEAFIFKIDTASNFEWAKQIELGNYSTIYRIKADDDGNCYLSGDFLGTVDFDLDTGVVNLTSGLVRSMFLWKINSNADLLWVKNMPINHNFTRINSMEIDSDFNVYAIGNLTGSLFYDYSTDTLSMVSSASPGMADCFIMKCDSSGNTEWIKTLGGLTVDFGVDIAIDSEDYIYAVGIFSYESFLNPSSTSESLISNGGFDGYINKFDSIGNFVWAKQIGGSGEDKINSIEVDNLDNIITVGQFKNTVDFNVGPGVFNLTSAGDRDIFIQRLIPCVNSLDTIDITSCGSLNSQSGNQYWISSGSYFDTIINSEGCDSVLFVNLTIQNSESAMLVTSCEEFISPSGNYVWTSSGDFYDTIPNSIGCDSLITIHLIINESSEETITESNCNNYLSPSGNFIWTSSGIYMDTISNSYGCDSILTIDLTIYNSTNSFVSETSCENMVSPSGDEVWGVSGVYYDTIMNATGCDSTITIDLEIITNSSSSLQDTSCFSYISPSGIYNWNSNGTYFDTLTNYKGCDSIITLDLVITNIDTSIVHVDSFLISNAGIAQYQWLDCIDNYEPIVGEDDFVFLYSSNGSYAVEITKNGCVDTSSCIEFSNIGLEELQSLNVVFVSPNPSKDVFEINFNELTNVKLEVYDVIGELIYADDKINKENYQLNLNVPMGVYFLNVRYQGLSKQFKLLVK